MFFSALYYGVSICLVSFASAMAVVTLNIHYRGLRGAEVSLDLFFFETLAASHLASRSYAPRRTRSV